MNRITIVGAGFAAVSAIKAIRKQNKSVEMTVISSGTDFIYGPSLIWIPTKLRTRKDLTLSLQNFFERNGVRHVKGEVSGMASDGRSVTVGDQTIENDALIIASGARFIKAAKGIENTIALCEGLDAAEKIDRWFDTAKGGTVAFGFAGNPKEVTALRGGPIFELMLGLDTFLRKQGRRESFTFKFFSPAPKPGIRLGDAAYNGIMKEMERRNIEVASLGAKISEFRADGVTTEKNSFDADITLFMPGLTGPAWITNTTLPISEGGMIVADGTTRVSGFERVYAAGDCASYTDAPDWGPKQAHMADLQGKSAGLNCLADLEGRVGDHRFRWELVCIVDTLDGGTLVFRNKKVNIVFPCRLLHWAKRAFERLYMKSIT